MTVRDENVNEAGKEAASTASASKAPCYDTAEFLKLLFQPGDVWEVRAPKCPIFKDASATATASGYFNDPWKAAKQAKILDQYRQPRGVYVTINPVEPVLLARTNNKIDDQAKSTTADRQILRRRWLFIDIDPVRPADVSSTSEEMGAALALSKKIRSELKEAGWPEPISGMSGNGAFLLYRVDLPNDRQSTELVRRVLHGLAERFDSEAAEIDTATYNAARIMKIPGTTARKGADFKGADGNPARPHRVACFRLPEGEPQPVPIELLRSVAAEPHDVKAQTHRANGHAVQSSIRRAVGGGGADRLSRCLAFLATLDPAVSGDHGHNQLLRAACECFRFGLSDRDAWLALGEFNRMCQPPFTDADLEHKIADARRKVQEEGQVGCRLQEGKADSAVNGETEASAAAPPRIDAGCHDLPVITGHAWAAVQAANDPPALFRRGGVAVRIEAGDDGEPIIKTLTFDRMRHELARRAEWYEWKKQGDAFVEKPAVPPKEVVNDVLATPNIPLPVLTRIVEAPVFAADGTLLTSPGYHPASQTYYAPADGFSVPAVAERPGGSDLESARIILCDELLGDFPFVDQAEKAHAVALLLLPFARDLLAGPTPLHLIEKPSPGTGATLLIDMLAFPATGRPIPTMTEGRDEDEWRKRITAKLLCGPAFLLIDNLRSKLDSAAVSAAITCTTWEDRILGISGMGRMPVRCVWVATGNNPAVSTEIARRTIRIRMDARQDRPWLRTGFRHPKLRVWAAENRGLLVWAALTLIRGWIVAGKPDGEATLGMFERWSEVMGGILKVAGISGFLSNLSAFYDESDDEGGSWRVFLAAWWSQYRDREVRVAGLWPLATEGAGLLLGDGGEHSQRCTLGKTLTAQRDRRFIVEIDGNPESLTVLRGGTKSRATLWKLTTGIAT